jgi:hypothetical protein
MSIKHTNEELLNELRRVVDLLGRSPKQREFEKLGNISVNSYKRAFGGISKALVLLGEKPTFIRGQTREDVIKELKRVCNKLGKKPTTKEFVKNANVSLMTLKKLTNNKPWNSLLEEIEIFENKTQIVNKEAQIVNKELENEFLSLKKVYGREPTYKEILVMGKFSNQEYEKYFKSKEILPKKNDVYFENKVSLEKNNIDKSKFELKISNILLKLKNENKIKDYEYKKRICYDKNWFCDFAIIKNDDTILYVECDNEIEYIAFHSNEKANYYKKNRMKYIIITHNYPYPLEEIFSYTYKGNDIVPIKYEDLNITKELIFETSKKKRIYLAGYLFDFFRANGFPYPDYNDNILKGEWERLQKFKSEKIYDGYYIKDANNVGIRFSKHFSNHMFETKCHKKASMIDAFYDDNRLKKCLYNRMGICYKEIFNITPGMLRQGLRNSHVAFHASLFKPAIAKFIYNKYTSENDVVYDYSMGFGQRFMGAMSSKNNLFYIGCDPWTESIKSINRIAKFIDKDKYYIENVGAEYFCPEQYINKVSLAFSSPPYYDLEIYDNSSETQAYHYGYEKYLEWFGKVSNNIYKMLKEDGIFVINIKEEYFNDLKEYIKGFELLEVLKIKLSRNEKFKKFKWEPIYVLRKIK